MQLSARVCLCFLAILCVCSLSVDLLAKEVWPQFRGPNSSGVSPGTAKLPAEISPEKNLIWRVALPQGHSSPVIQGGRIFLTALEGKSLITMALIEDSLLLGPRQLYKGN